MNSFYTRTLPKEEVISKITSEFTDLDPKHIEMISKIYRFCADFTSAKDKKMSQYGLSDGRFTILMTLWMSEIGLKSVTLADQLRVSRATIAGLVESLEKDKLIDRKEDKQDKRAELVYLTAKGKSLMSEILPEHFGCISRFANCLNQSEVKAFISSLDKLQSNLVEIYEKP